MRAATLDIGISQFIVNSPLIILKHDGNSVRREVAVFVFRVQQRNPQGGVRRHWRFARFKGGDAAHNGISNVALMRLDIQPPSSCRRTGSAACESLHAPSMASAT